MHWDMDQGFSKINVVLCAQAQAMERQTALVPAFITPVCVRMMVEEQV